MECCVRVSIETVLQAIKFYTVVNWEKFFKKLTFQTVVLRQSECNSNSTPIINIFSKLPVLNLHALEHKWHHCILRTQHIQWEWNNCQVWDYGWSSCERLVNIWDFFKLLLKCCFSVQFWKQLSDWLCKLLQCNIMLTNAEICFGVNVEKPDRLINHLVLIAKHFIFHE